MPATLLRKWTLSIGSHNGTFMSRNSKSEDYESLEECREAVKEHERTWNRLGHYVWFARATGPNGEEVQLHPGTNI